jgi:valyl-tRNA synthetase
VQTGKITGLTLPKSDVLASAAWPAADPTLADSDVVADFHRVYKLITDIRTLRATQNVVPKKRITLHAPAVVLELVTTANGLVETLAGLEAAIELNDDHPTVSSPLAFEGSQIYLSGLVDAVDVDSERDRLNKLIEQKSKQAAGFRGKLSNDGYVNGAPPHLVQETRDMLALAEADLAAAKASLDGLS